MRRARGPWGWWLRPGRGRPGVFLSSHEGLLLVVSGEPLGLLHWASSISASHMCVHVYECARVHVCVNVWVCERVHVCVTVWACRSV